MAWRKIAFSSLVVLTGCVETFVGPDGRIWHSTECGSLSECYETAAETCRGRYRVEDSRSRTDFNYTINSKDKWSNVSSNTTTDFVFSCQVEPTPAHP